MNSHPDLIYPSAAPSIATLEQFWIRITQISSRTRHTASGVWLGSEQVIKWNGENTTPCSNCKQRSQQCIVDFDQTTCRGCRLTRICCDHKMNLLFNSTKDDFFSDFELPRNQWSLLKAVSKRKRQESKILRT
ncbi:hypothetical protein K438DRAFT_1879729 [Mycena galopus ATCC 62051]|nr:hypothetical protein K438DRAFT_1879729 [Mycena galopus ATCC 62051]